MASATGLYNAAEAAWDPELMDLCRIRTPQLDSISDAEPPQTTNRHLSNATILTAIGDGAAGNLGSGADIDGSVAINYGTSAAVRLIRKNTDESRRTVPPGLFVYLTDTDRAVVGGAISNAGNLHQWCMRELRLERSAAEKALSRTRAASDALHVIPFLVAERAPDWPDGLRGTISGLTQTSTAADVLRAAATSTFYRLADILDRLDPKRENAKQVIVSGGILQSPPSLKILADCLGCDITVSRELESSLRGAAVYALEQMGLQVPRARAGKLIRFNRALSEQHRSRRAAQHLLQQQMRGHAADSPTPLHASRSLRRAQKRSSG